MTFLEFLRACGEEPLADMVSNLDFARASLFSDRLERRLRQYYFVGGMPGWWRISLMEAMTTLRRAHARNRFFRIMTTISPSMAWVTHEST